jgi:hypothetical protein
VSETSQIALPPELAGEVPVGEQLKIVLMWEPLTLEQEWRRAGRRTFEAAYCPEDSVYKKLMDDAAR